MPGPSRGLSVPQWRKIIPSGTSSKCRRSSARAASSSTICGTTACRRLTLPLSGRLEPGAHGPGPAALYDGDCTCPAQQRQTLEGLLRSAGRNVAGRSYVRNESLSPPGVEGFATRHERRQIGMCGVSNRSRRAYSRRLGFMTFWPRWRTLRTQRAYRLGEQSDDIRPGQVSAVSVAPRSKND
jgi:hypothetical protein